MNERHEQDFGQMPGSNGGAPNPSFRDGPAREPAHIRWWAPVLTVASFTAVFVILIMV
jgi:hypothetical protein